MDTGRRPFDLDAFVQASLPQSAGPPERIETKRVRAESVVQAIRAEAAEYDLVVLGCTREPLLYRFTHRSVPDTVARTCGVPVIMAKAGTGLRSWIKRWI